MKVSGTAHTYGDNVDTDVIIPARYLNTSDPRELAQHCLEDLDPAFAANVKPGAILVAGRNFGCGSSREHAVMTLKGIGVGAILAGSYGRIFYRNAINLGVPALECKDAVTLFRTGDECEIDLMTGKVTNLTTGKTTRAEPVGDYMMNILRHGGIKAMIRERLAAKK